MAVGAGTAGLCALLFLAGVFQSVSYGFADRLFVPRAADARIHVIAIDDASISKIGRWPWDRAVHAKLIRTLAESGASVIAYDVNFPESQSEDADGVLANAIEDAGNVVLPIELRVTEQGQSMLFDTNHTLQSVSRIGGAARRSGHSNTPLDRDGVSRRIPLEIRNVNGTDVLRAFGYEAALLADASVSRFAIPRDNMGRLVISFPGAPGKGFPVISAADVLQGTADLSSLKGAIVFVGSTAYDLHDAQLVPTSDGVLMPGVEVHASLADTVLSRAWLTFMPPWQIVLCLILIGWFFGLLVPFLRVRWSLVMAGSIWIGWMALSFFAFDQGVIVDIVWPTIAIVGSYLGVMIERRIVAESDRRAIRQVFAQYVSPSVVDAILRNPERIHLGGERRTMTVLFADIRSFTSVTEQADAQELVGWLNAFLHRMTLVIFEHRGVLDKYMGDAIMAFWNAPLDEPNHATLAVEAALDMRNALEEMNAKEVFGKTAWKIGVGINTGEMVVGNVGGEAHTDYTVIGDSVNLASRLEGLTKTYGATIIVSRDTADQLGDAFFLRRLDRVMVKGRNEAVDILEVIDRAEKALPEAKERVRLYEQALDAYLARRFDEAVSLCERISKEDVAARVLCGRAATYQGETPGEDWDGAWVYTNK